MVRLIFRYLSYYWNSRKYLKKIGVTIGRGTKISTFKFGSDPYLVTIGDNCHITKGVSFITHDGGVWCFRDEYPDMDVFGKITIGNNVYIGNNAVIMPGVTVGSNVVIGAHSVITKSIPDNSVVAGVPGRFLADLSDFKEKMISKNFGTKKLKGQARKDQILKLIDEKGIQKPYLTKFNIE